MKPSTLLITGMLVLLSCSSPQAPQKRPVTGVYGADFIEICVDSTLHLDRGTSTPTYLIDFSAVRNISDASIRDFFNHNKNSKETNLDSLQANDTNWKKSGFFLFTAIKFGSIQERNDSIIVTTAKIIATQAANGAKIVFRRKKTSYECLYSRITWMR